jgi:hypothetical protein
MSTKAVLAAKALPVVSTKMQFSLAGFTQVDGSRVFAFEGLAGDRTRHSFTVKANLALARQYRIPLQDLPLLCRALLDGCEPGGPIQAFTYSEAQMRQHADNAASLKQAARRRVPPRPNHNATPSTWPMPASTEIA